MAVSIVLLGVMVLVGAWEAGAAQEPGSGAVFPALLVGTVGDNDGSSLWKTDWNRAWATLVATTLFPPKFVIGLRAVWT